MIKNLFVIACIVFILMFTWLFFPTFDFNREKTLITWQKLALPMPYRSFSDFTYAIAEKRIYVFNGEHFFYSDDLAKWQEIAETAEFRTFHREEPFALAWFKNRLWAFFNREGKEIWSSKDGKNWQLEADKVFSSARIYGKVCSFNDKLWLVNSLGEGEVFSSDDGKVWIKQGQCGSYSLIVNNLLVFNSELWVMGHDWGNIYKTSDGKTWQKVRLNFPGASRNSAAFGVFDDKLWLIGGQREYSMRETIKADPLFFLFFLNPQGSSKRMKDLSDTWYSKDGQNWVCNSRQEDLNFLDIKAFNLGSRFILIGDAANYSYNSARDLPQDKYVWEAIPTKP